MEIKTKLEDELKLFSGSEVMPVEMIEKLINDNKIKRTDLHLFLNYYENIGIAYFNNVADKKILFILFAGGYVNAKKRFFNYITELRGNRGNKNLWINFEKLGNEWEKELS